MIINHNISALNTYRQLGINQNAASKAMEKLSSGLRINRAGDDAAGLAISEKMRGQIRGLNQASRNAQDGISLIQTAEGALQETHAILQRMRELAVQSANDTNTDSDRAELQKEIEQLKSEIDRIASNTEFNTKNLLDGSIGNTVGVTAINETKVISAKAVNSDLADGTYTLTLANVNEVVTVNQAAAGISDKSAIKSIGANAKLGEYTIIVSSYDAKNVLATIEVLDRDGTSIGKGTYGTNGDITVGSAGNEITIDGTMISGTGTAKLTIEKEADFTLEVDSVKIAPVANKTTTNGVVEFGGMEFKYNGGMTDGETNLTVTNKSLTFHIGANANQNIRMGIEDMSASALNVKNVDVSNQSGANAAITTINDAIEAVSSERSKLGAIQNRLEHTIANLDNAAENLTAAESRIRDVDMAKEVMEMTRANILGQASQAMLAQANQRPQAVLQLLQ